MIPTVNGCCCCISLRNGTIAIGIYIAVNAFFEVMRVFSSLSYLEPEENEDTENKKQKSIVKIRYNISLIWHVFLIVVGVVLTYAACKRLANWLFFISIVLLVTTIIAALQVLLSLLSNMDYMVMAGMILSFLLYIYFTIVVWSYYKELDDEYSTSESNSVHSVST